MHYQLITTPEKGIWFVLYTMRPFPSYPYDYKDNEVLLDAKGNIQLFKTGLAAWKYSLRLNDGFHEHPALRIRRVQKMKFPRVKGKFLAYLD